MRNAWFDRATTDRRLGMRRATLAAWGVTFVLFALVLVVTGIVGPSSNRSATPDHAIASLVAHAVPPAGDACRCTELTQLEPGLETPPAPSLC